eukprot:TRINITY_DN32794_c0_g1_i1.p1 TRINITY_DN32794_c0_g1~~TRINITY_DN32794_c0_g1_i1.p1  ORF type:complete len:373 (+),score=66.87 TRINITY_DN32794_c0_g1_i1:80-1198(+)
MALAACVPRQRTPRRRHLSKLARAGLVGTIVAGILCGGSEYVGGRWCFACSGPFSRRAGDIRSARSALSPLPYVGSRVAEVGLFPPRRCGSAQGGSGGVAGGRLGPCEQATLLSRGKWIDGYRASDNERGTSNQHGEPPSANFEELLQQMLGTNPLSAGAGAKEGSGSGFADVGTNQGDLGGDIFATLLKSMAAAGPKPAPPKASDAWLTDRLPALQRAKKVVMPAFFVACFWRGYIGRWGLLAGVMSKSYYDMAAVPLRLKFNRPIFVCQFYVDMAAKGIGYFINVARGKATFPPKLLGMLTNMPGGFSQNSAGISSVQGGFPWVQQAEERMPPTASTVPVAKPLEPRASGVGRTTFTPPAIVDADVTFVD